MCSGLNLPFTSHHSAAIASNLAISAGRRSGWPGRRAVFMDSFPASCECWAVRPSHGGLYRMPMDKFSGQKRAAAHLFPPIDPFDQRMLDVGDGHHLYVEQCGNPDGAPGGRASWRAGRRLFSPAMRRYFRPEDWRIILFDQRGCGRSRPHASVRGNTTWHLWRDIERIREHAGDRTLGGVRRILGRDAGPDLCRDASRPWPTSRCAACSCPCSGSWTGSTAAARGSSGRINGRVSSR
jgi:hypothetical protein